MEIVKNDITGLNEAHFELAFKEHFQPMCYFAHKYIKDFETAKEIVHESFISLWDKRETIDTSKSVKSYLSTSVRNKCINYLRDHKKFNKEILQFENLSEIDSYNLSDIIIGNELETKINSAIGELPEKCREVFMLNRFENKKYQEVADELNISVKTVEAQMSKALVFLRDKLKEFLIIIFLINFIK